MASEAGIAQLKQDEGSRAKAYKIGGLLHIGIGFNLEAGTGRDSLLAIGVKPADIDKVMKVGGMALTEEQIDSLFQLSLQKAETDAAKAFPNLGKAPQAIQDVLVNMTFQHGAQGIRDFKDLRKEYASGNWKGVAAEIKDSASFRDKQLRSRMQRHITTVNKVKQPSQVVPTAIAQQQSAKETRKEALFNTRAQELSKVMDRQAQIKQLADAMNQVPEPEETTMTKETPSNGN